MLFDRNRNNLQLFYRVQFHNRIDIFFSNIA